MAADLSPRCPRCGGEEMELMRQQVCHERRAKEGILKGLPKLRSTTSVHRCGECGREFAVTVDAD